jgi:hypothetical protein
LAKDIGQLLPAVFIVLSILLTLSIYNSIDLNQY